MPDVNYKQLLELAAIVVVSSLFVLLALAVIPFTISFCFALAITSLNLGFHVFGWN